MFSSVDIAGMIDGLKGSQKVKVDFVEVSAGFSNAYVDIEVGDRVISGSAPQIQVATADLEALTREVEQGTPVDVDSQRFKVLARKDDGAGFTLLILREV